MVRRDVASILLAWWRETVRRKMLLRCTSLAYPCHLLESPLSPDVETLPLAVCLLPISLPQSPPSAAAPASSESPSLALPDPAPSRREKKTCFDFCRLVLHGRPAGRCSDLSLVSDVPRLVGSLSMSTCHALDGQLRASPRWEGTHHLRWVFPLIHDGTNSKV